MSTIDPTARIAPGAVLGQDVSVGAYCTIGPHVEIGDGCRLESHVSVSGHSKIGARAVISPFASLGSPPQSLHYKGEPTGLVIGSDCVIREYVTMSTGTAGGRGVTTVGDHCYFMANSHVGHDAIVGGHVILANSVAIGGFGEVGDHAFLGGLCAIHQFARVGEHAMIGAHVCVNRDVVPFAYAVGHRAELAGINRVGLMRRGFSPEAIRNVRKAYRAIFLGPGTLAERIESAAKELAGDVNAMRMVEFIRAGKSRRLATPRRDAGGDE
jgi:UDP-N-acetylglucosamine acyltransferase